MATETPKKGLLSGLLGDLSVNTSVGVQQADLTKIGATLFVFACLVILAWFTFKKVFK
jgi:hypothetical protein